jgi:hypothetical protein
MSEAAIPQAGANPFSPRAVLLLVVFGALVFVAILWMIGAGMTGGSANNGGAHAGGKGLNGYAGFATYLEKRGYTVRLSRSEGAFDDPGLLVLTPPHNADGEELDNIVRKRRYVGPTLIVTPKWFAVPVPAVAKGAKPGWVQLVGITTPAWKGFLDDVAVETGAVAKGKPGNWSGIGLSGKLPDAGQVLWGMGDRVVPLVKSNPGGRYLAAYIGDEGDYPALEKFALAPAQESEYAMDAGLSPIVLVFEPDLLDNYGFADPANASLAEALVRASLEGGSKTVIFDLTLNGLGRSANLLTLAFTPPFLAATLCLLLAALAIGWMAFLRFGPAGKADRVIAFGKRTLVTNAAGLMRRARRLHLIAEPYVERARDRIARSLALPRHAGHEATDQAIDRAMASRSPDSPPFTELARRLRAARSQDAIVKAARDLHALERTLTR